MVVEAVLYPLVSGDFRGNTGEISRKRRKNGLHNQFKPVISGLSGLSIRCQEQGNWVFVSANGLEISGKIAAQFSRATSGGNVRFTPKSGHSFPSAQCPLCAKSGRSQATRSALFPVNQSSPLDLVWLCCLLCRYVWRDANQEKILTATIRDWPKASLKTRPDGSLGGWYGVEESVVLVAAWRAR